MSRLGSAAVALLACLAGGAQAQPPADTHGPGPLFVSPAGQVFRPGPEGQAPLGTWFRQVDGDGDGSITFTEFRADFGRAFEAFDLDRDGEIAPAEVTRYETDVFTAISFAGGSGRGGAGRGGGGMGPRLSGGDGALHGADGQRRREIGSIASMAGAARFGLLPIPHPIMDADTNLNRGVSRVEFDAAAGRRFTLLDSDRSGRLTEAELTGMRAQARDRRGRRR